MEDNRKKHDELIKAFLTHDVATARDFLAIYLPKEIAAYCDLDNITIEPTSYIEANLRTQYSDIVYKLNMLNTHDKYDNKDNKAHNNENDK